MCKNVLTECIIFISYHVVPARSGDSAAAPGSGVTNSCKSPCGCYEPKLGPLQEQQGLSTARLSLQVSVATLQILTMLYK